MLKRGSISILVVVLSILLSAILLPAAHAQTVTKGLTYLSSTQNPDGSWGVPSSPDALSSTVAVIETLKLMNQPNPSALTWLQTQGIDTTDYLSERIHALTVSGADMTTLLSYIEPLTNAWGGYDDYETNNLDTALALWALKSVNYSDTTVMSSALGYLTSTQNTDGGWGFYQGDDSNAYMTALVLQTLSQFSTTYNLATPINKAAEFLIAHQNADGGFGTPASTSYETALTVMALIQSGQGQALVMQNAINFLSATQSSNGSWNDDPYSTALAIRALASVKPNLAISSTDIVFSNPSATVGDTIAITANIKNTGSAQADNVLIQFFDGDPASGGTLIGQTIIASIPAYTSALTTISWPIPTASTHTIYVTIDPLNAIDETRKDDNTASRSITAATLADISITPADITFSPAAPLPGDAVVIAATIRNLGETMASAISVDIYDGDPSAGGSPITSGTISAIGPGGSYTVRVTTTFMSGSHNIYVIADRLNAITESSKSNNVAYKTLQIAGGTIDLAVRRDEINHTPIYPVEGSPVTVNATVRNDGDAAAANILVRFYLGDPDAGGTQIGQDVSIPSLAARGNAPLSITWDTTGHAGNNSIYVKVDPLNAVSELTKINNKESHTIKVAAKTGPDLVITPPDIMISPVSPVSGSSITITANVRNTGTEDAMNVPVEFSLGDPTVGGTLILGSRTIPLVTKGGTATAQLTWNTSGFSGSYEIYANADPFNEIAEISETNNMSHATVDILVPQGPDLVITDIDTSALVTDTQTLAISGYIRATLQNKGNQPASAPFAVTAFEDKDGNKVFDAATDTHLGTANFAGGLAVGASATIDIPVSGTVPFRGSIIHVMADSGGTIQEIDKTNNTRATSQKCEYHPPVGQFNPVEKWRWSGSAVMPSHDQVMHTPVVARIIDTNGDGVIDEKDVPAIIFTSFTWKNWFNDGVLRAVRGDTGQEIFTVTDPALRLNPSSALAIGDIDNDGKLEIIGVKSGGYGLIAFKSDGTVKWTSPYGYSNLGGASIADLDHDGTPEIILGATVLNNDGTLKWQGTGGTGSNVGDAYWGPFSVVADIDLDGRPEIVAGNTVYRNDGTVYWQDNTIYDGYNAIANFNGDPYPEIVVVSYGMVYLYSHDGRRIWGPVDIRNGIAGTRGGPPTIADFDGDGKPEIGVAGYNRYTVIKSDGTILWQATISDTTSHLTGSSVFDFDGDGKAEVVYNDEQYLRIYRGATGQILFQTPNTSGTHSEYPLIVDVDNDNKAEIVVVANNMWTGGNITGIRVFEDANNTWVNTRKIWNQHTYHITNVNDDGSIPRYEENSWDRYNSFRCNSMLAEQALATPDLTASYITVDLTNYPSAVSLSARIGNGGSQTQSAGVDVAFYDGDPQAGGILLGSTQTAKAMGPGSYEDVSLSWSLPSAGQHAMYVVVDKDNKLHECSKDNNAASGMLTIGPSAPPVQPQLPDLEVTPGDITITPSGATEGQPVNIVAVIRNTGTAGASNVMVAFYDGDPANGGTLIGSITKAYIDAGASALAEMTWSTLGQSGRNYLHVIVDPQNLITELNKNNNATLIPIDVAPPTLPDLMVTSSDLVFSTLNPNEGVPVAIAATIHNLGTATGGIDVTLYDGDPTSGGTVLSNKTLAQIIPFGATGSVVFNVNTIGLAGSHKFHVVLDPANKIIESNKTNNTAWGTVIVGAADIGLTVAPDKPAYAANADARITVTVQNSRNIDRSGTLDLKITDTRGNVVTSIATGQPVALTANGSSTLTYTWNTGQTMTGDYLVLAQFSEAGVMDARESVTISIVPDNAISSTVTVDRISYNANQQATITSTVTSQSANAILTNLTATVSINFAGGLVLYTETKPIQTLLPGQLQELRTYWNTATTPPGTYPVTLTVQDASGVVLSSATASLTISGELKPSKLLKGTITLDKQRILQGDPVNISYNLTNVGNMDLGSIDIKVLTVHVVSQTVYDTLTDHTALLMGQSYSGSQVLQTAAYTAKDYLVILRAVIAGTEETLAGTYLRVEGAPSAPSLNSPANATDVQTLTPLLSVNNASDPNDDKLTYEFELYRDSGLTDMALSSGLFAEGSFVTFWQIPMPLTENATYYWRARAFDGLLYGEWMLPASFRVNVENDPPTAPILSAPADAASVASTTPVLSVNNAYDPDSTNLTYNFEVSADVNFTSIVDSKTGVFEGTAGVTSWQVTVPLADNTWYYWRAQADDWLAIGPWMQPARFFVNTVNDTPTAPVIISPADGSVVTTTAADIVMTNSTDPDSPVLTYLFEVDTAMTFDSPDLIRSNNVPSGQGATSFPVANLRENTTYCSRAKANDGMAESPWSNVVCFFVNTVNDPPSTPVLANPSDGSGVTVFNPVLTVHNATDPDSSVLTYEFEVYADAALSSRVAGATGVAETQQLTSWQVPVNLSENSVYYWRARAFDGSLYSGWMSVASFKVNTANDAPSAPALYAPANGTTLGTLKPTLSIVNATDPDSPTLTYSFEVYSGATLVWSTTGVAGDASGITSVTLTTSLVDNTAYTWRARAFDGDRYGAWMASASFSTHLPVNNITATIEFEPETLNKKSNGQWVTVEIELPSGYLAKDVQISSIRLEGVVPAEPWPYHLGCTHSDVHRHDGDDGHDARELMVKFSRAAVINILPNGDQVKVHVTGRVGTTTFEGVDTIRVIK